MLPAGICLGLFFHLKAETNASIKTVRKASGSVTYNAKSQSGWTANWGCSKYLLLLKFRRLWDPHLGLYSIASTAFQLPQGETPIGKSRAPQCKYCFWFSHKHKTVTENTVVIHSFPKQTQISYLRNSRFLGPSTKITCLKLKLSSQSSEITDYKFLL